MYHAHFGLRQAPFKVTPDRRLFFPGGKRGAVLEAMVYAILSGEAIIKVVGEVGSGKTMLCRMLEARLPEQVEIVYLANPSLSPENILHAIALELRLPVSESWNRLQTMHALQQLLLRKHAQARRVVMFVEEAQSMPTRTLEEIRLLSNLETQNDKLLQIVLFGQPELDTILAHRDLRQLRERIAYSFQLPPLDAEQIRAYLNRRLLQSGAGTEDLFTAAAVRVLGRYSQGLLRRVNILADKSLLAAYVAGTQRIGEREVLRAVRDSGYSLAWFRAPLIWKTVSAMALGFMLTVAIVGAGYALTRAVSAALLQVERPPGR